MTSNVLFELCMLELEVLCFSSLFVFFLKHKTAGMVKPHTPVLAFLVCGVFAFLFKQPAVRETTASRVALLFSFLF